MKYGKELAAQLREEIERYKTAMADRSARISDGSTDIDDCFISQRVEERGRTLAAEKLALIENDGGYAWFPEYATLNGDLVNARWCKTQFGYSLRAEMPDGSVVWTTATTKKGLARKGLKKVLCRRSAWFRFQSSQSGLLGVYTGEYVLFPSDVNYSTGEPAEYYPIEITDCDD